MCKTTEKAIKEYSKAITAKKTAVEAIISFIAVYLAKYLLDTEGIEIEPMYLIPLLMAAFRSVKDFYKHYLKEKLILWGIFNG